MSATAKAARRAKRKQPHGGSVRGAAVAVAPHSATPVPKAGANSGDGGGVAGGNGGGNEGGTDGLLQPVTPVSTPAPSKAVASPLKQKINAIASAAAAAIASGSAASSATSRDAAAPLPPQAPTGGGSSGGGGGADASPAIKRQRHSPAAQQVDGKGSGGGKGEPGPPKTRCAIRAVSATEAIGQRPYMEDRHTIIHRVFRRGRPGAAAVVAAAGPEAGARAGAGGTVTTGAGAGTGGAGGIAAAAATAVELSECSFIGVYDGHGGSAAVNFVHKHMHRRVADHPRLWQCLGRTDKGSREALQACFSEIFAEVDDACIRDVTADDAEAAERNSGTTVLVAVVAAGVLHVAHVGDTRAVICRGEDRVRRLTRDHKPNLPQERQRIVEAGGAVIYSGCWRAACTDSPIRLAVSRALGDAPLKASIKCVSNEPDVTVYKLSALDEFVVFCSDGVWDVLSDLAVTNIVAGVKDAKLKALRQQGDGRDGHARTLDAAAREALVQEAADELVHQSTERGSADNITAVVAMVLE